MYKKPPSGYTPNFNLSLMNAGIYRIRSGANPDTS